jgi:broad specificity phosphatase PhoE
VASLARTLLREENSRPQHNASRGRNWRMTLIFLIQHGESEPGPGDPGLTDAGRRQAGRTAQWLYGCGLNAVYSSPQLRAIETAEHIAAAAGLHLRRDVRLRERMNWDGSQTFEQFLAEWDRSVLDREFVPGRGDSSRRAAARLRGFLLDLAAEPGPVAAVTHGGVTADLLRTLVGDGGLPPGLLEKGVPPGAITTFRNLDVVDIASVAHLA